MGEKIKKGRFCEAVNDPKGFLQAGSLFPRRIKIRTKSGLSRQGHSPFAKQPILFNRRCNDIYPVF
jgi:hypothetical protein